MGKAYSQDLRERVIVAVGRGVSRRAAAAQFSISASSADQKLKAWIMRKYKRFRFHKTRASLFLRQLARDNRDLFVHWQAFGTTTFT